MCRPASMYGSQNTVGSPKADAASDRAASSSAGSCASVRTIRMPRPPPPADALISTGKSASVSASDGERGQYRDASGGHESLGLDLAAHRLDRGGRRSDPGEPSVEDRAGERRVLRQEAVARMQRVGARAQRGPDEQVRAQVGVGGRLAGQPHRAVGLRDVR